LAQEARYLQDLISALDRPPILKSVPFWRRVMHRLTQRAIAKELVKQNSPFANGTHFRLYQFFGGVYQDIMLGRGRSETVSWGEAIPADQGYDGYTRELRPYPADVRQRRFLPPAASEPAPQDELPEGM
jgi:hypothetical protein